MKLSLSRAVLFSALPLCYTKVEGAKPAFAGKVKAVLDTTTTIPSNDALLAGDLQSSGAIGIELAESSQSLQVRGGAGSSSLTENLTICFYFLTWYALNVVYNSKCFSFGFAISFVK